jgi:hypothetical protein
MRSLALGAVAWVAVATSLGAQEQVRIQHFASLTSYVLSIPTGDTRDFITTPSWLGVTWEGVWAMGQRNAAGVSFGVHDFNHVWSGTTDFPWGAATGQQTRNLLVITTMATGRWYPMAERSRRLHLGLEGGFVVSEERYTLATSRIVRSAAHLAIAPEAGWQFPLASAADGLVSARYTIPVRNGSYIGGARSFPFMTLSIGVIER